MKQVINFVKSTIGLTSSHYPARSFKMLVLNVPNWFYMTFTIIKPLLNETMRQKVRPVTSSSSCNDDTVNGHVIDHEFMLITTPAGIPERSCGEGWAP